MAEYSYEFRIPRERLAVLIGKDGSVKKEIEEITHTKIRVDSDEGDVSIRGEDAVGLYSAKEIATAIGRGFNPEIAKTLLRGENVFDQINLSDFSRNPAHFTRLKGRIIGSEGKCRKLIEELSETNVSVYGKTISIIGEPHNVSIARRAVNTLLKGSPHSTVYRWLERNRATLKRKAILGE